MRLTPPHPSPPHSRRVLGCKYQLPEGFPPIAAELATALLVLTPTDRLGGAAAEGAAARHGRLRAHAFFEGVRCAAEAGTLHLAPLPLPSLQELCLPIVCTALHMGGWHRAALGGAPSESWSEPVRRHLSPHACSREAAARSPSPSPSTLTLHPRHQPRPQPLP